MSSHGIVAALLLWLVLPVQAIGQSSADEAARGLIGRLDRALVDAPDGEVFTAWRAELAALERRHGFVARALVVEAARAPIDRQRAALRAQLDAYYASTAARDKLARELEQRRRAALRFIGSRRFTKARWGEGERLIAAVRAVWSEPLAALAELDGRLAQARARHEALTATRSALLPDEEDPAVARLKALDQRALGLVDPRCRPSKRFGHAQVVEVSQPVLAANKQWPGAGARGAIGDSEREVMRLVNAYRMMMGRKALYYCGPLVKAARLHSDHMAASRIFAHRIKGHPHGYSCKERAQTQRYRGLVLENIAAGGVSTAVEAHQGWLGSPPHHRAVLNETVEDVGVARNGNWWTELLGWRNPRNRATVGTER